jgi:hypothetical protein
VQPEKNACPRFANPLEVNAVPSIKTAVWSLAVLVAAAAPATSEDKPSAHALARMIARDHLADYDSAVRLPNGHVDSDALVKRLKELGVNTYYWLVLPSFSWDDLTVFLPKAAKAEIDVWVYLVPPTESPPRWGTRPIEPFHLDYLGWAEGIARLSLEHPNVTAWVIDDFYANHDFFNPAYLREIRDKSKAINPRLAFLPLMYFPELQPKFLEGYRAVIDGVVVAYLQDREEIERTWAFLNDGTILPISALSCPTHTRSRPGDYVMASAMASSPTAWISGPKARRFPVCKNYFMSSRLRVPAPRERQNVTARI